MMCAGCMACVEACPTGAVKVVPGIDFYRPTIEQGKCIDCGRCQKVCQQLHPASFREPIAWFQGWAEDSAERSTSSSGGIASAVARAFAAAGGAVCACTFSGGRFGFEVVDDPEGVGRFKGSKYVKSDPSGAYKQVSDMLKAGRRVLFIGLPCQISAMRNFVGPGHESGLYTIDLICHGTPSPQILEMFLRERGYELAELRSISFRKKSFFGVGGDGEAVDVPGVIDHYLVAFLHSLDYTENCYSCIYARTERVSDLTLGDSWGSELSDEAPDGISLALCQTDKGENLLRRAGLKLLPVDAKRAISCNDQLCAPSRRPSGRDRFLRHIAAGEKFERAVGLCLLRQCLKQDVKRLLLCLGIVKSGGGCIR